MCVCVRLRFSFKIPNVRMRKRIFTHTEDEYMISRLAVFGVEDKNKLFAISIGASVLYIQNLMFREIRYEQMLL